MWRSQCVYAWSFQMPIHITWSMSNTSHMCEVDMTTIQCCSSSKASTKEYWHCSTPAQLQLLLCWGWVDCRHVAPSFLFPLSATACSCLCSSSANHRSFSVTCCLLFLRRCSPPRLTFNSGGSYGSGGGSRGGDYGYISGSIRKQDETMVKPWYGCGGGTTDEWRW